MSDVTKSCFYFFVSFSPRFPSHKKCFLFAILTPSVGNKHLIQDCVHKIKDSQLSKSKTSLLTRKFVIVQFYTQGFIYTGCVQAPS